MVRYRHKKTYMNTNIKEILKDLLKQEKTENDLISLYSMLMDSGVDDCLFEEKKLDFHNNLDTLKKDSERHKLMLLDIINKYQ